jgi:hypothetical protein
VEKILSDSKFRLVFRPHPLTGSRLPEYSRKLRVIENLIGESNAKNPANGHFVDRTIWGWQSTAFEIMIGDVSAVSYEWLGSRRPLVLAEDYSTRGLGDELELPKLVPHLGSGKVRILEEILRVDRGSGDFQAKLDSARATFFRENGHITDMTCLENALHAISMNYQVKVDNAPRAANHFKSNETNNLRPNFESIRNALTAARRGLKKIGFGAYAGALSLTTLILHSSVALASGVRKSLVWDEILYLPRDYRREQLREALTAALTLAENCGRLRVVTYSIEQFVRARIATRRVPSIEVTLFSLRTATNEITTTNVANVSYYLNTTRHTLKQIRLPSVRRCLLSLSNSNIPVDRNVLSFDYVISNDNTFLFSCKSLRPSLNQTQFVTTEQWNREKKKFTQVNKPNFETESR